MRRRNTTLAAATAALLVALALFAASASATFEATLALRTPSARKAGPIFTVEAGGGRRTRILDFSIESGRCGSIYAPLIDAGQTTGGFAAGKGAATFTLGHGASRHIVVRLLAKTRKRILRLRQLSATLIAVARDGQGLQRRTTIPVILRLPGHSIRRGVP